MCASVTGKIVSDRCLHVVVPGGPNMGKEAQKDHPFCGDFSSFLRKVKKKTNKKNGWRRGCELWMRDALCVPVKKLAQAAMPSPQLPNAGLVLCGPLK